MLTTIFSAHTQWGYGNSRKSFDDCFIRSFIGSYRIDILVYDKSHAKGQTSGNRQK